jgi:hypothetical protein
MPRDPLPLSVLLALGLANCNSCRPGVCLSIAQDPEVEDISQPCLSFVPDVPPEEGVEDGQEGEGTEAGDEVEAPPEPRPGPCLSIRMPDLDDVDHQRICLSEDVDFEPDVQPCLSEEAPPDPPPVEEGAEGDGDASLDGDDERLALLERLGDTLPADVRDRL